MATRATAVTAISLPDLRACLSPAKISALVRKFHYPVEPLENMPIEEGSLPGALRDGVGARYPLATIGGEQFGDPRLDLTLFVLHATETAGPLALARGIAQAWPRRFAGHRLLVFAIHDAQGACQRLIFVNPRRLGRGATGRFKLHCLIMACAHPTRHDADTLNRLALSSPQIDPEALYKLPGETFDVWRLTDEF